ncbi:MAG: dihydrofolate reductase family protein [Steroidobacteraceae bacterium]
MQAQYSTDPNFARADAAYFREALEAICAGAEDLDRDLARHADIEPSRLDLAAVLRRLRELEVNDLQVEAGARLSGSLQVAGFVDEVAGLNVLDNAHAAARH